MPKYDPSNPLNLRFKILQDYLKDYESKVEAGTWGQKLAPKPTQGQIKRIKISQRTTQAAASSTNTASNL